MTARSVPGRAHTCVRCKARIVFSRTLASPTGRGGQMMPLDPYEDPNGNAAVRPVSPYSSVVRVLGKDDTLDNFSEIRAMPHFATCAPKLEGTQPPAPAIPSNVVDIRDRLRARRARR